jgi:hypothetical protein
MAHRNLQADQHGAETQVQCHDDQCSSPREPLDPREGDPLADEDDET